jgi:hypothetical protein
MLDPVSLIVYALVQALNAGAQEAGRAAGRDAYVAMKTVLLKKYGAASESIRDLERAPESPGRQEQLAQTLRILGAGDDPELLRLADQLVDMIYELADFVIGYIEDFTHSDTKQFQGRISEVHAKIPTLELIRENARVQLSVLELVSMLRFLKQNADAVGTAVETLQGFRLTPLTPTKVRRLLGPRA